MYFLSSFPVLQKAVCAEASKFRAQACGGQTLSHYGLIMKGPGEPIGKNMGVRIISSRVIENFKFDGLNFQGVHIEQHHFSGLFEFWYSNQSY